MTDFATRLTNAERAQTSANVRPKDAATLILVDHKGKAPRVLMGRRHPNLKFMPNMYVFPGGRLEAFDKAMPVYGIVDADSERRLMQGVQRPSLGRVRGLAAACIREMFEETGLMVGTKDLGAPQAPCDDWRPFETRGVFPNLEALTFVARAITPPRRPRRFDTRFFVADASAVCDEEPGKVGENSELVDLKWLTFDETKAQELPTVTRVVLDELAQRIEAGFHPRLPVPSYAMRHGQFVRTLLD
ncbi:NUDIX hydrolase [Xanthobacter agilis]|jgi:8-oxo-dGTP pyrophosphatase MutT (NUDIX family)|uniref:8-oxo-dGTP pyrophosphatase MutT (NUDIX family) n=1 Tax=Xanthobacter agilis TaxID=47492 RepID=A0ABU0LB49_XANAG|nr:NUDIX hydrolase [Xanthobacter agilis]MDQ0504364.1 8-oxo-dGTP pyrophosphatase MutT (NUDIX family) [Xanthobacter agilis]